jgi:uncharacterized membrane protein YfcA
VFADQYLWLFFAMVVLGAFTQGFTGVGFGIIVLAGIAFSPWDFERTAVVVNLILPFLNLSIIYASRRESRINWHLVVVLLLGIAVGVPAGYWFILTFGNDPIFKVALGTALTLFAANELFRPRIKSALHMGFGLLAGFIGGFFAGGFTAAGPPIALFVYSRHKDPVLAKGTLQFVFMSATLWRLGNIIIFGKGVTMPIMTLALESIPIVILLVFLGHRLSRQVSSKTFLRIVYSFIGLAGLLNVIKGFLGMWKG